uniref:Uncharacterized protein n=1 Tax=Anguilla anguilla TaxID=7936 RepID=A0A0E9QGZ2_ANGAN
MCKSGLLTHKSQEDDQQADEGTNAGDQDEQEEPEVLGRSELLRTSIPHIVFICPQHLFQAGCKHSNQGDDHTTISCKAGFKTNSDCAQGR